MPNVRTTMRPDVEIEVDQADYLDLKRQGLLVETTETQPDPTPGPAASKKAAPSAPPKEG